VQETEAREPEMFGPAECKRGVSPFMEAASKVSLEIVQLLHRRGARAGITAPCAAQSLVPGRLKS
jgi:hypothetical protein